MTRRLSIALAAVAIVAIAAFAFVENRPSTPAPAPARWIDDAAKLERAIDAAIALAATDRAGAAKAVDESYRTIYENDARNIEVATRQNVGAKIMGEREDAFARLKQALKLGAPPESTKKIRDELVTGVRQDAAKLDEMNAEAPK